ncbi:MAG: DUF418 domain-containing protein [Pricia sp.]
MQSTPSQRIEIIDSLRGFALAGIVICHFVENYIGAPAPASFNEAVHPGMVDNIIDGLIYFFLRGKFIALFSFLFGLSFFIQMDNGAKRGTNFAPRFLWRLFILLLIGYVHSLFYRGDILTIYAILGVLLVPFYKMESKYILAFSALLFLGLGRYVVFYLTKGDSIWGGPVEFGPEAAGVSEYYDILKNGSIGDVFRTNAVDGHQMKLEFQFGFFGRGYFTFAFFLIGLYIGRSAYFKKFREEKRFTKRVLIGSIVTFVIATVLTALAFMSLGENMAFDNWTAMLGLTAMDVANTALTFIYIALFIMLYRKAKPEKWLSKLAPYGMMALTNYVAQSLIGTWLLFGWGLGLIGELRVLYTFGIGLLIIILQVWTSQWWLQRFKYGPLEWMWRSITFFRVFPMAKEPIAKNIHPPSE